MGAEVTDDCFCVSRAGGTVRDGPTRRRGRTEVDPGACSAPLVRWVTAGCGQRM